MLLKARTARHKTGGACSLVAVVPGPQELADFLEDDLVEAIRLAARITSWREPGVIHLPMLPLRETARERGEGCER
jgi:hypothetical protein